MTKVGRVAFLAAYTGRPQSRARAWIVGTYQRSSDRNRSGDWTAPVFCWRHRGYDTYSPVLTSSMVGDLSRAGYGFAGITTDGSVSERWIGFS